MTVVVVVVAQTQPVKVFIQVRWGAASADWILFHQMSRYDIIAVGFERARRQFPHNFAFDA